MIDGASTAEQPPEDIAALAADIRRWAAELGMQALGIASIELAPHDTRFREWLAAGNHGEMDYMARHGEARWRPDVLLPGTVRVITARMDYWPADAADANTVLADGERGYVARYALGRDYHKVFRNRLAELATRIRAVRPDAALRPFVDSAPVLERGLSQKAGLGWIGKNTLLIHPKAGSWFFLGEIYTDLPLPADAPFESTHCGSCSACLDICPTKAFTGPWQLDARRCIAYLTIELQGSIPEEMRPGIGNRVFGCDDCQLACPWNRFAQPSREQDFVPRHGLDDSALVDLFSWSEEDFATRAAGSPLHRLGHSRWLRNIAVALGNGPATEAALAALAARLDHPEELVREHTLWAWERLQETRRKNASR
jgi:epoxyqueuosine reductase